MGAKKVSTGVDGSLTERALRALLKHHESSADDQQLLGNDLDVQVQFSLARIPGKASAKPIRVEIPHPLVNVGGSGDDINLQDAQVCIIVKEESKPWVQAMIERFPNELGCVKKVLGLQSLRTKHKSFAQRRELLARFDIFFADDRILPMLTKALGGKFFEKKKQPIPISLTRKEALPFAVQKNVKSTFMFLSAGTCVTVKAGNTGMDATKLLENIQSIAQVVPDKVPKKWANIRSVSIKTSSSVALPIYNKTPQELEEIMRLAKEEPEQVVEEEKSEKATKKTKASTPLAKALKKQSSEENDVAPATSIKKKKMDTESAVEKTPKTKKRKESTEDAMTSAKKKKKKKSDSDIEKIFDENDAVKKTPKSSKKVKKDESIGEETTGAKKTPKSTTKAKTDSLEGDFVASKKFVGSKKGFVFTKGKKGLGYYKDVKPVVDKAFLASLSKRGGGGGGRKSMGQTPRRRKGSSRRSY
jgi:ribosome biogenesis protein UTP30